MSGLRKIEQPLRRVRDAVGEWLGAVSNLLFAVFGLLIEALALFWKVFGKPIDWLTAARRTTDEEFRSLERIMDGKKK